MTRALAALLLLLQAWFLPSCRTEPASDTPSETSGEKTAPSQKDAPQTHSFLWRVSTPAGVAHLLGSVHIAEESVYPLAPAIEQAFQASTTLVVEVDLGGNNKAVASQRITAVGVYPPGDELSRHISPPVYSALERYLKSQGMSPMDSLRPWFIGMALTIAELQRHGFNLDLGIDEHFRTRAGTRPVVGLETIDQQVTLFSELGPAEQEQLLEQALADLPTVAQTMRTALLHWKKGNAEELNRLLVEPVRKDYPVVYQKLLTERNRHMTEKIEDLLKKPRERYFIVVGAAHLVGPDSILTLLKRKGYTPVQL